MCGMSGAGIDVGVLCLCFTKSISIARSEYLETISKKKLHLCHQTALYKSFYVWYCIIQVFFEVTSFCRILEYYIILGLSFVEFKNCKQNRTIDPEQTNNPMMLRLNSFWYRHYAPFPCTSNRINVVSYTWEQQLQQNSIDWHSN